MSRCDSPTSRDRRGTRPQTGVSHSACRPSDRSRARVSCVYVSHSTLGAVLDESPTNLIPRALESQKSSKSTRNRGGVGPSSQPKKASSDLMVRPGYCSADGGASAIMSAPVLEKLLVSAMIRHFPAAGSRFSLWACFAWKGRRGTRLECGGWPRQRLHRRIRCRASCGRIAGARER